MKALGIDTKGSGKSKNEAKINAAKEWLAEWNKPQI
jgi:dsRNA-specific ribonuclease